MARRKEVIEAFGHDWSLSWRHRTLYCDCLTIFRSAAPAHDLAKEISLTLKVDSTVTSNDRGFSVSYEAPSEIARSKAQEIRVGVVKQARAKLEDGYIVTRRRDSIGRRAVVKPDNTVYWCRGCDCTCHKAQYNATPVPCSHGMMVEIVEERERRIAEAEAIASAAIGG